MYVWKWNDDDDAVRRRGKFRNLTTYQTERKVSICTVMKITTPKVGLGLFGASLGPLVDAIHNQVLLQYDTAPVELFGGSVKTSLLIPPLLSIAYVLLGDILPNFTRKFISGSLLKSKEDTTTIEAGKRAAIAVSSSAALIKLSEVLTSLHYSSLQSLCILSTLAFIQFLALDGSFASLALAFVVGIFGPLAELPLMVGGCWHYIDPDYFPFDGIFPSMHDTLALSAITGPCYAVVTTDAIAVGKFLSKVTNRTEVVEM